MKFSSHEVYRGPSFILKHARIYIYIYIYIYILWETIRKSLRKFFKALYFVMVNAILQ